MLVEEQDSSPSYKSFVDKGFVNYNFGGVHKDANRATHVHSFVG